jgi:beta-phosphoglucomutase-like phosphatase (HAD superfamily)
MVDVVLLAFDGAFAETAAARRDALRRALAVGAPALGDLLDPDADVVPASAALDAVLRAAGPDAALDATARDLILLRADRHFSESLAHGVKLVPGTIELVSSLAGRVRVALVSAAERDVTETVLALAGVEHVVERVVTVTDAPTRDTDGAWRLALAHLGHRLTVTPDRVLALAHHAADVRAARALGLRTVAVGALPAERALEATAWLPSLAGQTLASIMALTARDEARVR